jgi:hypothetical protein
MDHPDRAAGARALPADTPERIAAERERVIEQLSMHFADDRIALPELESRLDRAYAAGSVAELRSLVGDLPVAAGAPPAPLPASPLDLFAPADEVPARGVMFAVMGGQERGGSWIVPRHLKVFALMGGAVLDLRRARFAPGVTVIDAIALMGGIEVIVPPGVRVDCAGGAFMGGFDSRAGDASDRSAGGPVVRLDGLAIMGGVEARTRYPGESAKAARRRERGG